MFYDGLLQGRYVDLRSVEEGDAEFTLEIRQDPEFTRFLPRIENTLEQQKNWIQHQRNKEGDYFFVVQNKAGERIGTIGLFDVTDTQCEGGRLAIRGNPLESIEAQFLSFQFAFQKLHLQEVINYIYMENERALRFSMLFGGVFVDMGTEAVVKDGHICRKTVNTKQAFEGISHKISKMLYRQHQRKEKQDGNK